jgi:hypothetical protein
MIAPTKSPMIPDVINPPIAPMKITSIGTSTPRPIKRGFRKASDIPTRMLQIAKTTAMTVLLVEKT